MTTMTTDGDRTNTFTEHKGWDERFAMLVEYAQEHGIDTITSGTVYRDFNLGRWLFVQRRNARNKTLEKGRLKRLKEVGVTVGPQRTKAGTPWDVYFSLLEDYLREHDEFPGSRYVVESATVDGTEYVDIPLGRWVYNQRTALRAGRVSNEKRERLGKVGITGDYL